MSKRKPRPGSRGRRPALVAASCLVVAGLAMLAVFGYQVTLPQAPPQLAEAGEQGGKGDTQWSGRTARAANRSTPTSLSIPRIDVSTELTKLSMDENGVLDAPDTGDVAGWYRSSATPGQRGSAVIAGHVDWSDGPAVFYELGKLEPEDTVKVKRADGRVATFRVHAIRQYAKNEFPSKLVYGQTREPELRLITCGGAFADGHYVDNIVVFAHLVSVG